MVERPAAEAFLIDRYEGRARDIEPLGAGAWSRAFSFTLDGGPLVARFGAHRDDFEKDRDAVAFDGPDLPVPRVLEVGEAFGGAYAVSERRFGVFLETLDADAMSRLLPALMRMLDAMREHSIAGERWTLPSWRGWLLASLDDVPGRRTAGWHESLKASDYGRLFERAKEAMTSLLPACPEQCEVLHRDLLNRNVLVSSDGTRLEAVFDWGCGLAGDAVYEVALLTFWSPWYPALGSLDIGTAVREHLAASSEDVEHFDERRACYELHVGLEHLAYATFTGAEDHRARIAERTEAVLARLP